MINGEEKPEEVDSEDSKKRFVTSLHAITVYIVLYLTFLHFTFAYRRPLDTSDCPICFESFNEEEISTITFCRTCGNNVHMVCFDNWKSYHPGSPTCVYCRSPWHLRPQPQHKPDRNSEGYVNLAKAFGLSNKRGKIIENIRYCRSSLIWFMFSDASTYKMDKYGHYAYEYEDEDP